MAGYVFSDRSSTATFSAQRMLGILLSFLYVFACSVVSTNAETTASPTLGNLTGPLDTTSMLDHHLTDVAWGNGRFVAVGALGLDETEVLLSDSGTAWERVSLGMPTRPLGLSDDGAGTLHGVAWNGSVFTAVGERILSSIDGKSWTRRAAFPPCVFSRVRAHGSRMVAVGAGGGRGCIATSADGTKWTAQGVGRELSQVVLTGVAWADSEWLILGTENQGRLGMTSYLFASPDGEQWTRRSGPQDFLVDLARGPTLLVAVGGAGTRAAMFTSFDAQAWNEEEGKTLAPLRSVLWNGALFVAVGIEGTIATARDGKIWTAQRSGVFQNLLALAWNGTTFVAVGDGLLLSSPDGVLWKSPGAMPTLPESRPHAR